MQRTLTSAALPWTPLGAGRTLLAPDGARTASRSRQWCRSLIAGLALLALAAVGPPPVGAQSAPALPNSFIIGTVQANGKSMPYTIWLPPGYSNVQQWPVILFLHGSSSAGTDGFLPATNGIAPQLSLHPERFPCLVVMPQLPVGATWVGAWNNQALQALEDVVEKYGGDRNRLYLTGLSLGGNGTWSIAADHPTLFAAAMPVAGWVTGSDSSNPKAAARAEATAAQALRSLPLWVFHGGADPIVSPVFDRQVVALIRAEGNPNIHYTQYSGVGHDAWDPAYSDPKVIAWLFAQKR